MNRASSSNRRQAAELNHGLGVCFDAARVLGSSRGAVRPVAPSWRVEGAAEVLSWSAARRILGPSSLASLPELPNETRNFGSSAENLVLLVRRGRCGSVTLDYPQITGQRRLRLAVIAEPGSRLNVLERVYGAAARQFDSAVSVSVGRRAEVSFVTLRDLPATAVDWSSRQAHVEAAGQMRWLQAVFSEGFTLARVATELVGAGARVDDRTLLVASGSSGFDAAHQVRHEAARTVSEVGCRAVMLDAARANCRVRLTVPPRRPGCQGRQKSATLMLGSQAEFSSQPELDVNTDDVQCGHGAAVGRLDPERLFYLMSRGLSREQAERQLTEGFLEPLLADLSAAGADDSIRCLIAHKFIAKL